MADKKNEATPLRLEWEHCKFKPMKDGYECNAGQNYGGAVVWSLKKEWVFSGVANLAVFSDIAAFMQQLNERGKE